MTIPPGERIDALNIGLMLLATFIAILIPFELFLFSYAILGPLHYLTEISWLHDKKYYTKGRYDALFLLLIGLAITLVYFNDLYHLLPKFNAYRGTEFTISGKTMGYLAWIALLSALLFATVKSKLFRGVGFFMILASLSVSAWSTVSVYLTIFLPTLIHVYVFTGLFMLYGALKSKSKLGILSVIILILCPVMLFTIYPDTVFFPLTDYGRNAYIGGEKGIGFIGVHMQMLSRFFNYDPDPIPHSLEHYNYWIHSIFNTKTGILLTRCIAFAYTYHYLNWFSKTSIIKWHKVPKKRFALVIVFWLISIALYSSSYQLGLQWLFFISYMHVLLELPLNFTSFIGVVQGIRQRLQGNNGGVSTDTGKPVSRRE